MSDSETAMAVAAAIAALRDDDEDEIAGGSQNNGGTGTGTGEVANNESGEGGGEDATKGGEAMEEEVVEKPKPPRTKVMSCLICTKPVTSENTQMGSSNSSSEYERMMRVICKLLCVDSHPMLKQYKFRHSEEPKKLCCDECCEVVFNVGSLQSIIDRTKLAINKKLDWILKTVSDSAAEESEEIEKVFFSAKSDVFRTEVVQVCQRKNAKNGLEGESDDEEEELVNKAVQTEISGESGVSELPTKAGLKSYERPSFSFDDTANTNMDTYSDHNDDMSYSANYDDDNSYSSTPKTDGRKSNAKTKSSATSSYSNSKAPTKRGRPSNAKKASLKFEESDDDIEVLEEKKVPKGRGGRPPAKSAKLDAREMLKVEYNSESGRPKRSTASRRPNYQMLADGDEDEYVPKRHSVGSSDPLSRNKKPPPRKEVTLSAIPIVKDASGKTYFEGVEIVRTDKSITCKHLGCYYVVDGSGYNAFERIKAHIHDTHIGDGALPDIY